MKIYDPETDESYTGVCEYCGAKLMIYPSDLDYSKPLNDDTYDCVCISCGGQIQVRPMPYVDPLPECYECGDIWLENGESRCPCNKVRPPGTLEKAKWFLQESKKWTPTPSERRKIMREIHNSSDQISHPSHYPEGSFDNIEKIIDGLPAAKAVALANVLKYAIRAGRKEGESLEKDLGKARNYAHRLVAGKWIWEEEDEYE